jgi:superfamily II DNA or RNA helicase
VLDKALTYTKREFLYGLDRKRALADGRPPLQLVDLACYTLDHKQRVACAYGFYPRIRKLLRELGHEVNLSNLAPHPHPEIFEPDWSNVLSFTELRYRQQEFLELLINKDQGRFDCPPGFGKTMLIALAARLFPKAKIDITAVSADVCRNICSELETALPNVGLIGGGKKQKGHRVTVYVAKSLCHSPADADILFGDECHQLPCDSYIEHLTRYRYARKYGMSATHDMRLDGQDMRVESVFGPIIMQLSYQEGEENKLVVPIRVEWTDVEMDYDPCAGMDQVEKLRHGIWRNDYRNSLIAADARQHRADEQVLIVVNTIDHAVHLKQVLPEFTLVYAENGLDAIHRRRYTKWGLIPENEPLMTLERRSKLRVKFESGELKKVIATGVWSTGVDFRQLEVLIRADASGSPTLDTQLPGRISRLSAETGKNCGILRDYRDQFNKTFAQRAKRREANYAANGWE